MRSPGLKPKIRLKTLTVSSSKELVKMNFTIGICLTCTNQFLSRFKSSSDCNNCWKKEGRKEVSLSVFWKHQPLVIGNLFERSGVGYLLESREKETKQLLKQ